MTLDIIFSLSLEVDLWACLNPLKSCSPKWSANTVVAIISTDSVSVQLNSHMEKKINSFPIWQISWDHNRAVTVIILDGFLGARVSFFINDTYANRALMLLLITVGVATQWCRPEACISSSSWEVWLKDYTHCQNKLVPCALNLSSSHAQCVG